MSYRPESVIRAYWDSIIVIEEDSTLYPLFVMIGYDVSQSKENIL